VKNIYEWRPPQATKREGDSRRQNLHRRFIYEEHTSTHAQKTDPGGFGSLRGALLDISRCFGEGVEATTLRPSYASSQQNSSDPF